MFMSLFQFGLSFSSLLNIYPSSCKTSGGLFFKHFHGRHSPHHADLIVSMSAVLCLFSVREPITQPDSLTVLMPACCTMRAKASDMHSKDCVKVAVRVRPFNKVSEPRSFIFLGFFFFYTSSLLSTCLMFFKYNVLVIVVAAPYCVFIDSSNVT